jgi:hypothetical protein
MVIVGQSFVIDCAFAITHGIVLQQIRLLGLRGQH